MLFGRGRGGMLFAGLLLLLPLLSEGFVPFPRSRSNKLSSGAGQVTQTPVEAGKEASLTRPRPSVSTQRLSSTFATTVVDNNTPSDVADVDESPALSDVSREPNTSMRRRSLSDSSSAVKDELIELVSGGFLTNSARKRAQVSELLIKLESLNPTEAPAYSPLLNGPWSFLYTGGISPGMLGLQLVAALSNAANGAIEIKDTTLLLSRAQPRVEVSTTVSVLGRETTFKIRTNLEPESDLRLKETYVEATTGTLRMPLPRQGIFERSLFISYLDDDLLIVRDSFGAPDILIRKDKSFYTPFSGVPSATDDDTAPGAG